jgi:hypothetical protein
VTILYCLRFETPQPGGPGLRIYIPRNRVAQLYPHTLGSLLSPPTTQKVVVEVFEPTSTQGTESVILGISLYIHDTEHVENTASVVETCLLTHHIAMFAARTAQKVVSPLLRNRCCGWCLPGCYLAVDALLLLDVGWYPLNRRLDWPQSQSGRREEERILDPAGTRTLIHRSSSL